MLSIVMSGLQVSQKALDVTSNNVANAGTVGFKGSEASFEDVFANDPSTGSKVAVGSGVAIGAVTRSTSQGQLQTTGNVTDLAIAGSGYFVLQANDQSNGTTDTYYSRAGNFTVNASGQMCDPQGNLLQCFSLDGNNNPTKTLQNVTLQTQLPGGEMVVPLAASAGVGTAVSVTLADGSQISATVAQADVAAGFIAIPSATLTSDVAAGATATYPSTDINVPLNGLGVGDTITLTDSTGVFLTRKVLNAADVGAGSLDIKWPSSLDPTSSVTATATLGPNSTLASAPVLVAALTPNPVSQPATYQAVVMQNIAINTKGLVQENYSDGSSRYIGSIALANFPDVSGLKPIGNTDFVACQASGPPTLTQAGAPYAGDIHSGALEQSNVDITQELMGMLKAQQIYNGNARMMQTEVEMAQRITDKL